VRDALVPGFYARAGARAVSYRLSVDMPASERRRLLGAPRSLLLTLGTFPALSPRQARREAKLKKGLVAKGVDPRKPGGDPAGLTIKSAWELYLGHLRRKGASPRTIESYTFSFNRLQKWHHSLLANLALDRTGELQREHDRLADEHGPVAARMSMQLLKIIYRHAARSRDLPMWRDSYETAKPRSRARDRRVPEAELPKWRALAEKIGDPQMRALTFFILFSGLRQEDARTLQWEYISVRGRYAKIPKPKGGEDVWFYMPLSRQMIRILAYARLEWRRAGHRRSRWCFPSLRSASGAFTSHRPEAKGKPVPAGHTLRHTWANIAWAAGVAEQDRSVLLNHALRGETLRYSDPAVMLPYFGPVQQRISDRIERALRGATAADVSSLSV